MTACPDCTKARAGTWGGYAARCSGCTARAIARSEEAWNAMHPAGSGDVGPLSAMVDKLMGDVPREQAVQAVREWFKHGTAQREGATP